MADALNDENNATVFDKSSRNAAVNAPAVGASLHAGGTTTTIIEGGTVSGNPALNESGESYRVDSGDQTVTDTIIREITASVGPAMNGTGADDSFIGGPDADIYDGGDGNDFISGLGGDDHLSGGTGDDVIVGGAGSDRIDGGTASTAPSTPMRQKWSLSVSRRSASIEEQQWAMC